jgi:hypothetical protein
LKSPTAIDTGELPTEADEGGRNDTDNVLVPIGKYTTFDRPPPGDGFLTVIAAELDEARSAPGTTAVSCELLTKVVASGAVFQSTVAPETKPVPLTVRVIPWLPGAALAGTKGWVTNGTGFPGGTVSWALKLAAVWLALRLENM